MAARQAPADGAQALFSPIQVGEVTARNRIAMAPCTRQRAHLDGTPTDIMVDYYRQRAGAGLIISEGISPCAEGNGYLFAPGLYTDDQQAQWARIAAAVRAEGGAIFAQIMHVGRLTDPLILPRGAVPVAPSAVRPDPTGGLYTVTCPRPKRPYPEPHALTTAEVEAVVETYAACARRALAAGFDGVEVHAGSGYLPMQFLSPNTNRRTDRYGGGPPGRARFLLECVEAMQAATRKAFVAVKFSPGWTFHDVFDDNPLETYAYAAQALSRLEIAYLQVGNYGVGWDVLAALRPHFRGPFMGVVGFTRATAAAAVAARDLDLVAFGQGFIANPDLVERFQQDWPLNPLDVETLYTQGAEGYTDYPAYRGGGALSRD
jgi:N-ethylmaleimide reductase